MKKVLANGKDTRIGIYEFPDRKKPCLCVVKGNQITVYGTLNNKKAAQDFMAELIEFLGAEPEDNTKERLTNE